jgi:hypothetical protein
MGQTVGSRQTGVKEKRHIRQIAAIDPEIFG